MAQGKPAGTGKRTNRVALLIFVLVSAATCLALGWWQWERFENGGGDGQNLGYAFQWPLFAIFFIYAYRRFVRIEDGKEDPHARQRGKQTEIPQDLLPERPAQDSSAADDPTRREYNAYLESLAAEDAASKSTGPSNTGAVSS